MKMCKKGQGATEYLLMLAAVLVIVAIAVYYITTAAPAVTITGSAEIKSGDNTVVLFTPTTMTGVPENIPAADWSWKVFRGADIIGEGAGPTNLVKNVTVELDCGDSVVQRDDIVRLWYKGAATTGDAARVM